ncbi:MAG: ATP-binding protein [Actinomycetes bacterium]
MLQQVFSPWGGSQEPGPRTALPALQLSLPADLRSPKCARDALEKECARWGAHASLTEAATLVASELVTNSVLHARTPLLLMAAYEGEQLVVAVSDGDPRLPQPRLLDPMREDGRGLRILESWAVTWGVQLTILGKVVWVMLVSHPTGGGGLSDGG